MKYFWARGGSFWSFLAAIVLYLVGCYTSKYRRIVRAGRRAKVVERRPASAGMVEAVPTRRAIQLWLRHTPFFRATGQSFLPVPWRLWGKDWRVSYAPGERSVPHTVDVKTVMTDSCHIKEVRGYFRSQKQRTDRRFVGVSVHCGGIERQGSCGNCLWSALKRVRMAAGRYAVLAISADVVGADVLPRFDGVKELIVGGGRTGQTCCGGRVTGAQAARLISSMPDLSRVTIYLRGDGGKVWKELAAHSGIRDVFIDWDQVGSDMGTPTGYVKPEGLHSLVLRGRKRLLGSLLVRLTEIFRPQSLWITGAELVGEEMARMAGRKEIGELFVQGRIREDASRCPNFSIHASVVGLLLKSRRSTRISGGSCIGHIEGGVLGNGKHMRALIVGRADLSDLAREMKGTKSGRLDLLWLFYGVSDAAHVCSLIAQTRPTLLRIEGPANRRVAACIQHARQLRGMVWALRADNTTGGRSEIPAPTILTVVGMVATAMRLPWSKLMDCAGREYALMVSDRKDGKTAVCQHIPFDRLVRFLR